MINRASRRADRRGKNRVPDRVASEPALFQALNLHKAGELGKAEEIYRSVLRAMPQNAIALHFLGVACFQQGRREEGIEHVQRALTSDPSYVDAWSNLGNLYKESERAEDAEAAYRRALAVNDSHAEAWNNLGIVLRARGQASEAVTALQRAVQCSPKFADAYFNLGNALRDCSLIGPAIEAYRDARAYNPAHTRAHNRLGMTLYTIGAHEEAAKVFSEWLAAEPGNPVAAHMFAACSGENVPARASDAYIRTTFDGFASSFDDILLHQLEYRAPQLLLDVLAPGLGQGGALIDVLDAGCGTGLCGPLLKPYARSLIGVDLSNGMLAKARARKTYDLLHQLEITDFLGAHPLAFDVIVAADMLCYFGDLHELLLKARMALRPGGSVAFTVERSDDVQTYRIQPHGRYSHSGQYVERVLDEVGFAAAHVVSATLRRERGTDVEGWVVRARVPGMVGE